MAIKCGKCKEQHGTADEVRACYGVNGTATVAAVVEEPAATEKQVAFIKSLAGQRKWEEALNGNLWERCFDVVTPSGKFISRAEASAVIEALMAAPKVEAASESVPGVPAGYYAIDIDGTVKFYRVDRPTEGKWANRIFVSVQASDEFHSLRNPETRNTVLNAILAQGCETALARYGQLIGRCGVCNRTLTDETSRALGIGPICREK